MTKKSMQSTTVELFKVKSSQKAVRFGSQEADSGRQRDETPLEASEQILLGGECPVSPSKAQVSVSEARGTGERAPSDASAARRSSKASLAHSRSASGRKLAAKKAAAGPSKRALFL